MQNKFQILKDSIKRFFSKFYQEYKYYIIVFIILFLIAVITGIMTASSYSKDITYDNFINSKILLFLNKEKGVFSLFFSYAFGYLCLCVFAIFFMKNIFFNLIEIVFFLLYAYIVGFDLCVMIFSFGLIGVVFGVFVYSIGMLIVFATLIIILCIATKNLKTNKYNCPNFKRQYFRDNFVFLAIGLVVLFAISCLFSILHIFIIVD